MSASDFIDRPPADLGTLRGLNAERKRLEASSTVGGILPRFRTYGMGILPMFRAGCYYPKHAQTAWAAAFSLPRTRGGRCLSAFGDLELLAPKTRRHAILGPPLKMAGTKVAVGLWRGDPHPPALRAFPPRRGDLRLLSPSSLKGDLGGGYPQQTNALGPPLRGVVGESRPGGVAPFSSYRGGTP